MLITASAVGMIMLSTAACYGIHVAIGHAAAVMIIMLLVLAVMVGRPHIITAVVITPAAPASPVLIIMAAMVGRLRFEPAIMAASLGHARGGSGSRWREKAGSRWIPVVELCWIMLGRGSGCRPGGLQQAAVWRGLGVEVWLDVAVVAGATRRGGLQDDVGGVRYVVTSGSLKQKD